MKHNTYIKLSASIFLIVGIAHLVRALAGWDLTIGSMMVPLWMSWVALIVALLLSYFGFRLVGKRDGMM